MTSIPASAPSIRQELRSDRRHWGGWSLAVIPTLVAAGLVVYPLLYNLWLSLHINRLSQADGQFVGWRNYVQLFRFGDLGGTLRTTVVWTLASIVFQGLIGFVLALALDRPGRGISLVRTLLLTPWVMPGVVISAIWLAIYNPIGGLANALLSWVGLPGRDWLGDPQTALPALILVNIWKGVPFWMLMLAAGMKAIPADLYELGFRLSMQHLSGGVGRGTTAGGAGGVLGSAASGGARHDGGEGCRDLVVDGGASPR